MVQIQVRLGVRLGKRSLFMRFGHDGSTRRGMKRWKAEGDEGAL